MYCPKCRSTEINPAGICLVCGFQMPTAAAPDETQAQAHTEQKEESQPELKRNSSPSENSSEEELPEWRQELSRRLQEIKLRRAAIGEKAPEESAAVQPAGSVKTLEENVPGENSTPQPVLRAVKPRRLRRVAPASDGPPPTAIETAAAAAIEASTSDDRSTAEPSELPRNVERFPAADIPIRPSTEDSGTQRSREFQTLIDTVTARSKQAPSLAAPAPEADDAVPVISETWDDKLILLSRTLAGMVDWIIVVLSAGSLVLMVDMLVGIEVVDTVSMIHYTMLLLLIYFLYSFFFLGIAGQTIGMMLTDLRLVGISSPRPRLAQILVRCITFLFGSIGLGVGLIWGCFNRQSMCLHDRFSQTQVVRIESY